MERISQHVVNENPTPSTPKKTQSSNTKTLPKTGNGNNLLPYAFSMLTSGILVLIIRYKRRKHVK
ncbi:MAG: LPXTG cell wall anchor domain-containing protein [Candidatus Fimenecus sp.]